MGNQPWPQFQSGIRERSIVLSHSEYYISQLISGNNKSFLIEKKSLEMAPISVSVKPFIAKFLAMQAEILQKRGKNISQHLRSSVQCHVKQSLGTLIKKSNCRCKELDPTHFTVSLTSARMVDFYPT